MLNYISLFWVDVTQNQNWALIISIIFFQRMTNIKNASFFAGKDYIFLEDVSKTVGKLKAKIKF